MTIINMLELTGNELLGTLRDATFVGPARTLPGGAPVSGAVEEQVYGDNHVVTYAGNRISPNQFSQWFVPGLFEVGDDTTTLATGLTRLREAEGLVGRQPDFHICDKRARKAYAASSGDSIENVPAVQDSIQRRVAALVRFEDLGVGQEQLMVNIRALHPDDRRDLARQFRKATTHGEYTLAVRDWNSMIGDFVRSGRGQSTAVSAPTEATDASDFESMMRAAGDSDDAPFGFTGEVDVEDPDDG